MKSRKTTERAIFLSTDPDIAGGFGDTSRIRNIDSRVSYTLQDIKGATVERVAEMANEQFGNHTEKAGRQIRQEELDAGLDYMNRFADTLPARLNKTDYAVDI